MSSSIKISIALSVSIFLLFGTVYSKTKIDSSKKNNVEVTYIANDGFLIKVNDKRILIDALFGNEELGFCEIPGKKSLDAMIEAKKPFKNIDLTAATHAHRDHFHAPFVMRFLENHKETSFLSCSQSINKLKDEPGYNKINQKLIDITPDSLCYKDTVIESIKVRIYRLRHSSYYLKDSVTGKTYDKHRHVENVGFLFDIDGVRIFHAGDSSPSWIKDYKKFRLDKQEIDIAFIGRSFMWKADCKGLEIIRKYISPSHIVLMHIKPENRDHYIKIAREVKDEFPSVKVFDKRLEKQVWHIEK